MSFVSERALWHLCFLLGESYDDFVSGLDGCLTMTSSGIAVGADVIPIVGNAEERTIAWAVAHAVFGVKFSKTLKLWGTTVYNRICGFSTPEPKKVGRVLKALSASDK